VAHRVNVQFSDQAYKNVQDKATQKGVSCGEVVRRALELYTIVDEERALRAGESSSNARTAISDS